MKAAHNDGSLSEVDGCRLPHCHAGPDSNLIAVIQSRRSVSPKRLVQPGPSMMELATIVETGLTAPDYGRLRPWRFVQIPDKHRMTLAELFATAKKEECPDAGNRELNRAREKAMNGPVLLTVIIHLTARHPVVRLDEQYISLGAALQNILLAAHTMGYAAMLTSGAKIQTSSLQRAFCKVENERLVGFISFGTSGSPTKPRELAELSDHLEDWRPST